MKIFAKNKRLILKYDVWRKNYMITEKPITKGFQDYSKFIALYRSAFPRAERIPLRFLMSQDSSSTLNACYDGNTFCGFYSTLTFGDITHILFLAVDDTLRNCGYGSTFLELISHRYPQNRIILDIEAEDSAAQNHEQRIRRKAFYERNGYTESGIKYRWRGVPYKILIKNGTITEAEFDAFWENL